MAGQPTSKLSKQMAPKPNSTKTHAEAHSSMPAEELETAKISKPPVPWTSPNEKVRKTQISNGEKVPSSKNRTISTATIQELPAKVTRSGARAQTEKQGFTTTAATRPTLSDGKVERQIWQPSDGNGDPSPELVERYRSKKTGHPTWKLFTGRNLPRQPTNGNPPRFVYLDDKAAWDILHSKHWPDDDKHRYWPFDFTPKGSLSFLRGHRGRPVYEPDGKVFASIRRKKGVKYFFHGCHAAPSNDGSRPTATDVPKESSTNTEHGSHLKAIESPSPAQPQATVHSSTPPQYAPHSPPLPAPFLPSPIQETIRKNSQRQEQVLREILDEKEPNAVASASNSPHQTIQTAKRPAPSDSTSSPSPAPKRQRKVIPPYEIPPEIKHGDSELHQLREKLRESELRETKKDVELENLRKQCAFHYGAVMESSARLETSEKEGQVFRKVAVQLYARIVEQSDILYEGHAAMAKVIDDAAGLKVAAERIASDARTQLEPIRTIHATLDEVLDASEKVMQEAGLQNEFDSLVKHAMNTNE